MYSFVNISTGLTEKVEIRDKSPNVLKSHKSVTEGSEIV